jgi:hypothetical protein
LRCIAQEVNIRIINSHTRIALIAGCTIAGEDEQNPSCAGNSSRSAGAATIDSSIPGATDSAVTRPATESPYPAAVPAVSAPSTLPSGEAGTGTAGTRSTRPTVTAATDYRQPADVASVTAIASGCSGNLRGAPNAAVTAVPRE